MKISQEDGKPGRILDVPTNTSRLPVFLFILSSCASAPPPKEPEPVHVEDAKPVRPALQTTSELGTIDPAAVKRAFTTLDDKFLECHKRGLDRIEVLAGSVKFFVRIGADGSARWAYVTDGDLGDRATEKCLLDVVAHASWPKPDGGDAEVQYGMELPPQGREPSEWHPDRIASALGRSGDAIDKCKAGASASFRATIYVGPGGRVLSAGVATSSRDGETKADCLARVLQAMRGLPSPGSWPAKVTFGL